MAINDCHLTELIEHASELKSDLNSYCLTRLDHKNLLSLSSELEPILKLVSNLDDLIEDSSRTNESLELLELIDYLYQKYGHQATILEDIHEEAEKRRNYLISILCYKLENSSKPSEGEVLTIIEHLARCGKFSSRDLRLKYLQARDNWFNDACDEQSESFDSFISIYSDGLTMIFNEYKSIFGNESRDIKLSRMSDLNPSLENGALINSWLLLKASIFIKSLEFYLNQSVNQTPTMIADTIQKCFKLTSQLSSIGFDFSPQLRPLFAKALTGHIKASVERATQKFESSFAAAVSKSIETLLLPVEDEILRIANMRPEERPPSSIEHYPIFKVYCLHIIDSLRWLQAAGDTLSPVSLCLDTYGALNASMTRVTKALAMILNTDHNSTVPILTRIAMSFSTEVLSFFSSYCERLLPEKLIVGAIGLSRSEFKTAYRSKRDELKNFRLDIVQITSPLRSAIPALSHTTED